MTTLLDIARTAKSAPADGPLCLNCVDAPAERDRGLFRGCAAARRLERLAREVSRPAGESAILAEAALGAILETGPGAGRFDWPTARARVIIAALRFALGSVGEDSDPRAKLVLKVLEFAASATADGIDAADDGLDQAIEAETLAAARRPGPWFAPAAIRVVRDPRGGTRGGEIEDDRD